MGVEADYNDLLVEIQRLKEIEKKFSESQAEQGFLSSRLEELEENETGETKVKIYIFCPLFCGQIFKLAANHGA